MVKIGITGFGDAGVDQSWLEKVNTVDGIILVTKSPHLITHTPPRFVLHCTITGWGGSFLEPNVKPPEFTIPVYSKLVDIHGPEKIVLRIDPIVPTEEGIDKAKRMLGFAKGRVRISFLDLLSHVKERFSRVSFKLPWETEHAPLDLRLRILRDFQETYTAYPIEVCDEPNITCTGCVSVFDYQAMELDYSDIDIRLGKNHTPFCQCLASKVQLIPEMRQCRHGCLYCFWEE